MKKTLVALVIGSVVSTGAMAAQHLGEVSPLASETSFKETSSQLRDVNNEIAVLNQKKYGITELFNSVENDYIDALDKNNAFKKYQAKDEYKKFLTGKYNSYQNLNDEIFEKTVGDSDSLKTTVEKTEKAYKKLIANKVALQEVSSLTKEQVVNGYELSNGYKLEKQSDSTFDLVKGDVKIQLLASDESYDDLQKNIDVIFEAYASEAEGANSIPNKYAKLVEQQQELAEAKSILGKIDTYAASKVDPKLASAYFKHKKLTDSQKEINDQVEREKLISNNNEMFKTLTAVANGTADSKTTFANDLPDVSKLNDSDIAVSEGAKVTVSSKGTAVTVTEEDVVSFTDQEMTVKIGEDTLQDKFSSVKTFATNTKEFATKQVAVNKEFRKGILANTQAINVVAGEVQVNRTQINKNTDNIEINSGKIQANAEQISKNGGLIQKNADDIKDLRSDFTNLSNDYYSFKEQTNGAIAGVAAMGQLAQPYGVGKANVGFGVGSYNGEQAIAVGMGYRYNEQTTFRGAVAANTGNDMEPVIAASVNYEW